MRPYLLTFACLCSVLAFVAAVPLPASNQELDVLQIPLSDGKEIDVLTLSSHDQESIIAERNKRTIGLLRELFPDLTKQIDGIVNRIIAQVIRVAGPGVLRSLLGNRPSTPRTSLDADFDDDDDDDENANGGNSIDNSKKSTSETELGTATQTSTANNAGDDDSRVQIDLPTFPPESTEQANNGATDTQIDISAINKQLEETIRVARQVKEAEAAAGVQQPYQLPIPSPKVEETIQLSFNNELNSNDERPKAVSNELQLSEPKSPAIDELTLDSNEDTADLDDRNKRFLQFGGGGLASGSSSGSSGNSGGTGGPSSPGSGNFLFDVVRLFSGSVQTQAGDEAANSANSVSGSSSGDSDSDSIRANDGYTEGIPGPVTRLVVLANRGLANLVQDLILRVAATSEKFVNFKAKLITALI